jgi:UDP-glucose 4-epimerase
MAILVTRGAGYIGGVTVDYPALAGRTRGCFGQSGGGHRQALDYATPDGTAIRDYIHVSDLADALCRTLPNSTDLVYLLSGSEVRR